jgi:hypothetical protein
MCPDQEILSLYFDGELPSPWKEKMDIHLVSCKKCQSRLLQYRKLRGVLEEDRFEVSEELQNRVWDKVTSGISDGIPGENPAGLDNLTRTRKRRHVFWNRTVSLPFPAAAAAAAAFIIVAFLVIQGMGVSSGTTQAPGIAAGISTDVQDIIPVSDMNSVLQYLSAENMADYVIIRLPETRSFSSSGEPTLLRSADYSRRSSNR